MKFFKQSLLVIGVVSAIAGVTAVQADLPQPFDYKKASTNYVDNTTSGGGSSFGGVANPYYFGGTIGTSDGKSYCEGSSNCEDSDTAWKLFGGYKVTNNLSAEAAYVNLGDLHKKNSNSDVSAVTLNAVGSMPVSDKFEVFGKVGAMRWSSDNSNDGSESGFGVTYGVGAKMQMSETTKLRAEWEKFPGVETSKDDKTDVNMLSVGVELSTY